MNWRTDKSNFFLAHRPLNVWDTCMSVAEFKNKFKNMAAHSWVRQISRKSSSASPFSVPLLLAACCLLLACCLLQSIKKETNTSNCLKLVSNLRLLCSTASCKHIHTPRCIFWASVYGGTLSSANSPKLAENNKTGLSLKHNRQTLTYNRQTTYKQYTNKHKQFMWKLVEYW